MAYEDRNHYWALRRGVNVSSANPRFKSLVQQINEVEGMEKKTHSIWLGDYAKAYKKVLCKYHTCDVLAVSSLLPSFYVILSRIFLVAVGE